MAEIKRKHPLAECERCPLAKRACVKTSGPTDASIAVVSRSPGRHDVRRNKPFGGPSGKVLDHLLNMHSVDRDDVLCTNVVLCECDKVPKEAIDACRPRLLQEISSARTIIAAGSEAVTALTVSTNVNSARGYEHRLRDGNHEDVRVIATNNPALVLRDDSTFPNLVRDFRLALNPIPEPTLPDVDWTNNVNEGRRWLQLLAKERYPLLATDIETKGLRASADLVAVAFSRDGSKAVSFGESVCQDDYTHRNYLMPFLAGGKTRFLYHNGKFDVRNHRAHGIRTTVDEDTILLSWLLDERSDEEAVHKLEYLLMNELGWPNYEPREIVEWKRTVGRLEKQFRFGELAELPTPDSLYEYNALDCAGTAQLFPILWERAVADGVSRTYRTHLLRASEALVKMELVGIPYDIPGACDILEDEVWPKLDELTEEMRMIVGDGKYNPRSNPQNSRLVYDTWNVLHNLRYPEEKARSVDKGVYTEIKAGRFVVGGSDVDTKEARRDNAIRWADRFAEFQEWEKQRSTYLQGLAIRAEANGGILYTDFNLHTTVTGRLSSKNPNLQNITRTKPWLPDIRSLFMAREGCLLVNADYSQAELRSIAELSGDPGLVGIYREGRDLHDEVSERFFGPEYTKENRQNVKNMNFGVAYLQTAATFQEKHGIPEDQAQEFIDWWWENFTGVREWTNTIADLVTSVGEVQSPFGHKRRFHFFGSQAARNAGIREGINFLPQNIAANITLHAICNLADEIDWDVVQILLNVHDAILLNVPEDRIEETAKLTHQIMVEAPKDAIGWDMPFEVDVQIGERWGKMDDLSVAPVAPPEAGKARAAA